MALLKYFVRRMFFLIYIVEDDSNIAEIESYSLRNSGFDVEVFSKGNEIIEAMHNSNPQLIILDYLLEDENGAQILERIRAHKKYEDIPVIFVTCKGEEMDKVKVLDAGADDYITKPIQIMEFTSRVKAVIRRYEKGKKNDGKILVCGDIVINESTREVCVKGKECKLTYKEFELLKYLILNKGIVLSRDRIMENVWDFDFSGESRTVDMHIKTLRQKLGDEKDRIKTVRNVGYKIG